MGVDGRDGTKKAAGFIFIVFPYAISLKYCIMNLESVTFILDLLHPF